MRRLWVTALVGLSFLGALSSASAQRVGRDYGRDERSYGSRSYGERDRWRVTMTMTMMMMAT